MTGRDRLGLQVRDLRVCYGNVAAVRQASLDVPQGHLVALVGANGAGKSSILNAISGLTRIRSGSITFDGRDVTGWRNDQLVRAGIVQVPEGREILATLTVRENLELGAWHRKNDKGGLLVEMYERFPILSDRRDLPAGALSGGEQQMLAIARALLARPRLLLLDEPSMGLAPKLVDAVFDVIQQIRSEGTTVLLVEQNAHRALAAADYGYVMETGQLVLEGPSRQLQANERVIEAYLGEVFNVEVGLPDNGGRSASADGGPAGA